MGDMFRALTGTVRGRVITASDPGYDDARADYNAMHNRRPRAIVQCTDSADVMAVVAAARDSDVDLAIRGGGHCVPGFGTVDDGLVAAFHPHTGCDAGYGANDERLSAVRATWDPENLFHINQNIAPATQR
ncbi:MAG TPA: BBE domain-containing protein [Rubrobacter sp.]|nr:BBE domain-containing protein [Rubrobacter sp.]